MTDTALTANPNGARATKTPLPPRSASKALQSTVETPEDPPHGA